MPLCPCPCLAEDVLTDAAGGADAVGADAAGGADATGGAQVSWPRGTLLGRPYFGVHDQGHVAVLLGAGKTGKLLQSYVMPGPGCPPGTPSPFLLTLAAP